MKKFLTLMFLLWTASFAQGANPNCPGATGPNPHCTVLTWNAPTGGVAPTSYNLYTGGTSPNQCSNVNATTCTKIGTVTAPTLTFTYKSSPTVNIADGSTHYFVITSVNGTAESVPSVEVSAVTPFSVPAAPVNPTAVTQ